MFPAILLHKASPSFTVYIQSSTIYTLHDYTNFWSKKENKPYVQLPVCIVSSCAHSSQAMQVIYFIGFIDNLESCVYVIHIRPYLIFISFLNSLNDDLLYLFPEMQFFLVLGNGYLFQRGLYFFQCPWKRKVLAKQLEELLRVDNEG